MNSNELWEELMSLPIATEPKSLLIVIPMREVGNGNSWVLADDYNY